MKKFLLLLLLAPAAIFATPRVSPDLSYAVQCVNSLPEGQSLLREAESRGPIQIYSAPFRLGTHAMWNPDERAIVVNSSNMEGHGQVVRSILFELHNAIRDADFNNLDQQASQGRITRQQYIEARERIEHSNAVSTKAIVASAISRGILPQDTYWNIPDDFATYFQTQCQAGHSQQIGLFFDEIAPRNQFYR